MTDLRVNPPEPPVFIEPVDEPVRFRPPTARDLQSIMQEQRLAAASLNLRAALGRSTVTRYASHDDDGVAVVQCSWCAADTEGADVMTITHDPSCQTQKGITW